MNLVLKLNLFLFYKYVGKDEFGNKYYERKNKNNKDIHKRMVKYKGINEASKIPAKFHGWLHYYSDEFPSLNKDKFSWQKQHLPNLTGTKYAYSPKNIHQNYDGNKNNDDYKAWEPKE